MVVTAEDEQAECRRSRPRRVHVHARGHAEDAVTRMPSADRPLRDRREPDSRAGDGHPDQRGARRRARLRDREPATPSASSARSAPTAYAADGAMETAVQTMRTNTACPAVSTTRVSGTSLRVAVACSVVAVGDADRAAVRTLVGRQQHVGGRHQLRRLYRAPDERADRVELDHHGRGGRLRETRTTTSRPGARAPAPSRWALPASRRAARERATPIPSTHRRRSRRSRHRTRPRHARPTARCCSSRPATTATSPTSPVPASTRRAAIPVRAGTSTSNPACTTSTSVSTTPTATCGT